IPFVKPKPAFDPDAKSARWAQRVVNKPLRYGGAAALVLGGLAVPVVSLHLGVAGSRNDAPDTPTRQAYSHVAGAYGPGTNGPLSVVLDTDGTAIPGSTIHDVTVALAAEPGVASVDKAVTNEKGDIAVINVTPTTSPQDARTGDLLENLRQDTIP